jgi:hypothetical protein
LHPAYKLEYFKSAGWDTEWIQVAEDLVRTEFDHNYASTPTEDSSANVEEEEDGTSEVEKYESVCDSLFLL